MSLSEEIRNDISIFMDVDDFASEHCINGKTSICVFDDDRMSERADKSQYGVSLGERLLFVEKSVFDDKRPSIGSGINIDGTVWYVRGTVHNHNVFEIRLGRNNQ